MKAAIAWHGLPHSLHHSHVKHLPRVTVIRPRARWLGGAITVVAKWPQFDSFVFTSWQEAVLTVLYIHWADRTTVTWWMTKICYNRGQGVQELKVYSVDWHHRREWYSMKDRSTVPNRMTQNMLQPRVGCKRGRVTVLTDTTHVRSLQWTHRSTVTYRMLKIYYNQGWCNCRC